MTCPCLSLSAFQSVGSIQIVLTPERALALVERSIRLLGGKGKMYRYLYTGGRQCAGDHLHVDYKTGFHTLRHKVCA